VALDDFADGGEADSCAFVVGGIVGKVNEPQRMELLAYEEVIASGWNTFVQVGLALAKICKTLGCSSPLSQPASPGKPKRKSDASSTTPSGNCWRS